MTPSVNISVAADIDALPDALGAIAVFAAGHALEPRIAFAMEVVADEIISNVIRHGRTASGAPPNIRMQADADQNQATLTIFDDAGPFNPLLDAPAPDLDADVTNRKVGGLGAFLVKEMSDAQAYAREDGWNRIEATWRRGEAAA